MKFKNMVAAAAAITMTASPVLAAPTNPAASLSVAHARAGTPTAGKSNLGGGAGIFALLIVAGIAAIVIVDATKDDNSDSN